MKANEPMIQLTSQWKINAHSHDTNQQQGDEEKEKKEAPMTETAFAFIWVLGDCVIACCRRIVVAIGIARRVGRGINELIARAKMEVKFHSRWSCYSQWFRYYMEPLHVTRSSWVGYY